jgi:hypothetical protein
MPKVGHSFCWPLVGQGAGKQCWGLGNQDCKRGVK